MMNDEFEIIEQETLTDMREGMPMVRPDRVRAGTDEFVLRSTAVSGAHTAGR